MCNIRKFHKYVLLGGLAILPHIYSPFSELKYEIPKVYFFYSLTILLIFCCITSFTSIPRIINKKLFILVIMYYCCMVFTSILGVNFSKSIGGNYYRMDGIVTLTAYILFSLGISCIWNNDLYKKFTYLLSLSTAFINLFVLGQLLTDLTFYNFNFSYLLPLGYSFGNPNFLAGYLVIILPFLTFEIRNSKSEIYKKCIRTNIIATLASIFLTQSRAGIVLVLLYGILHLLIVDRKKSYLISLIVIFLVTVISISFISLSTKQFVAESRIRILTKGLLAFKESPFIGYGYANFDYAFSSIDWPIKLHDDANVDKAHGTLLEHLVTTGILGFTSYVLLSVFTLSYLLKLIHKTNNKYWYQSMLISLLLLYTHSQTNVISINEELYYWLTVGIMIRNL